MKERPILFDAAAMRGVLAGRKRQARLLAGSPLRDCVPGDRLWVREACAGGALTPSGQEVSANVRRADFVVFLDGWRQFRDGSGRPGPVPTNRNIVWAPAITMPRWASRATLIVDAVRVERLQQVGRSEVVAEGHARCLYGWYWRGHGPMRGLWRDPRPAYAVLWDATHGTSGERWADDPETVVIGFRLERDKAPVDPIVT